MQLGPQIIRRLQQGVSSLLGLGDPKGFEIGVGLGNQVAVRVITPIPLLILRWAAINPSDAKLCTVLCSAQSQPVARILNIVVLKRNTELQSLVAKLIRHGFGAINRCYRLSDHLALAVRNGCSANAAHTKVSPLLLLSPDVDVLLTLKPLLKISKAWVLEAASAMFLFGYN